MPDHDESAYEGIAPVNGQIGDFSEVIDPTLAVVNVEYSEEQKKAEQSAAQQTQDAFDAYMNAVENQLRIVRMRGDRLASWHAAAISKHEYKRTGDAQKSFGAMFETVQDGVVDSMIDAETNSFQYNGRTFFLKRQLRARMADGVTQEQFLEALDMAGEGDLAVRKVDSRALERMVKAIDEESEGALSLEEIAEHLPGDLGKMLKVESSIILSHRAAAAPKTRRK